MYFCWRYTGVQVTHLFEELYIVIYCLELFKLDVNISLYHLDCVPKNNF